MNPHPPADCILDALEHLGRGLSFEIDGVPARQDGTDPHGSALIRFNPTPVLDHVILITLVVEVAKDTSAR